MGRRRLEIAEDQIPQIEKLARTLTIPQIADFLGIAERTFHRRMEEDPEIKAAYKRGKAAAIDEVATSLLQRALKGSDTAAIFFLKTQARWRETVGIEVGTLPPIIVE